MNAQVTYKTQFECSYVLVDNNTSKTTYSLNSHRYQLEVTVTTMVDSATNAPVRVIDFETLKRLVDDIVPNNYWLYDNKFEQDSKSSMLLLCLENLNIKTQKYQFELSCETLAKHFYNLLQESCSKYKVEVSSITLRENNNMCSTISK